MKMLKNFFAAFIALFAIGLTVAAQAGAFESKAFATPVAGNCYLDADYQSSDISESITSAVCVDDVTSLLTNDPDAECGTPGDFFCCFLVNAANSSSCDQVPPGSGNRYQVTARKTQFPIQ